MRTESAEHVLLYVSYTPLKVVILKLVSNWFDSVEETTSYVLLLLSRFRENTCWLKLFGCG